MVYTFRTDKKYDKLVYGGKYSDDRWKIFDPISERMETCINKLEEEQDPKVVRARKHLQSAYTSFVAMKTGRSIPNMLRYETVKKELSKAYTMLNDITVSERLLLG